MNDYYWPTPARCDRRLPARSSQSDVSRKCGGISIAGLLSRRIAFSLDRCKLGSLKKHYLPLACRKVCPYPDFLGGTQS